MVQLLDLRCFEYFLQEVKDKEFPATAWSHVRCVLIPWLNGCGKKIYLITSDSFNSNKGAINRLSSMSKSKTLLALTKTKNISTQNFPILSTILKCCHFENNQTSTTSTNFTLKLTFVVRNNNYLKNFDILEVFSPILLPTSCQQLLPCLLRNLILLKIQLIKSLLLTCRVSTSSMVCLLILKD